MTDWIRTKRGVVCFLGFALAIAAIAGMHWAVNPYRLAVWLYSSDTGYVVIESRCAGQDGVALRVRQVVTAGFYEYRLPLPKCQVASTELSSSNNRELRQEVASAAVTYYGTVLGWLVGTGRVLQGEGIYSWDTRPDRSKAISLAATPLVLNLAPIDTAAVRWWWPRWVPFLFLPLAWMLARKLAAAPPRTGESTATGGPYMLMATIAATLIVTMALIARTDVSVHPDELTHVASARYYFAHWAKPDIGSAETLEAHRTNRYGYAYLTTVHPVYLLAGKFAVQFWPAVQNDVVALRLFNVVLFGALVVVALARTNMQLAMIPLLATPQAWYVFCYFNNDALPLFLSELAVVAFLGMRIPADNESEASARAGPGAWAGVVAGLILLSKPNYWPVLGAIALLLIARARWLTTMQFALLAFGWLVALAGVFLVLDYASGIPVGIRLLPLVVGAGCVLWPGMTLARSAARGLRAQPSLARVCGVVLIATTLVIGLELANEARTNALPLTAERAEALREVTESTASPTFRPSATKDVMPRNYKLRSQGVSLAQMFAMESWFTWTFMRFLGVYGYLNIGPATPFFFVIGAAFVAVAIGVLILVRRYAPRGTAPAVQLSLLVGAATLVAGSIGNSWLEDLQLQGRYLLGILPILGAGLVVAGAPALRSRIFRLTVLAAFALSAASFVLLAMQGIPKQPALY